MDQYDQLCSTLLEIQSSRDYYDTAYLNALSIKMTEVLDEVTGHYLHSLYSSKPDEKTLKMIVDTVPSALTRKNERGQIPIQTAVWYNDSVKYIPLLAQEGINRKIGHRGGLLLEDPTSGGYIPFQKHEDSFSEDDSLCLSHPTISKKENVLQLLSHLQNIADPIPNDKESLNAITELRDSNLLFEADIHDHNLFFWACGPNSKQRLDYFARWSHGGLEECRVQGEPILHHFINSTDNLGLNRFEIFLEAALNIGQSNFKMLFQKNDEGEIALENAVKQFGKYAVLEVIEDCLPSEGTNLPVLHYIAENTPQFQSDFAMSYASTALLLNEKGRKLNQVELASGLKTFEEDATYFIEMTDDEIQEADPWTNLYPFMVLASGETSDLSAVYYLLRRNPSLVITYVGSGARKSRKRKTMSD